jgi:predicted nucleic acid-binding protein
MRVLLDTNILTRGIQPDSPLHTSVKQTIPVLHARGDVLCLFPQNLYEFWVVCTRPVGENGLGLTTAEAAIELDRARNLFQLLSDGDEAGLLTEWERLIKAHDVKGKRAHDARLVAGMRLHGLTHILTFNAADFARFPGIHAITPEQVVIARSQQSS